MTVENKTIKENLKTLEENFMSKTSYEVINELRIAIVDTCNNLFDAGKNPEEVENLSKINELLNKYLRG